MTWFFDPLLPLHYELIVIDPPWGFDLYSKDGAKKSALAKYELMRDDDVRQLPVGSLASMNCLLYCWATAPQLPLAIDCVKAWGFEYKSVLVWRKTTPAGKIRMGTGYRVRTTGEVVVVATLGNPKQASCQSARNVDPLSASNIHPPVGDQRLACPALAGVAEGRPSAGDGYLRL